MAEPKLPRNIRAEWEGYWESQDNGVTYTYAHYVDGNGNPAGGMVSGLGLDIHWQDGPLAENDLNGAFIEDAIQGVINRLEFYQRASECRFACPENSETLGHLRRALQSCRNRTARRRAQGVEGTHQPHDSGASVV